MKPTLALGTTLLLSSWFVFGQDAPPAAVQNTVPVLRVRGGVTPPRIVYPFDPEYPYDAQRAEYQGTCVLSLIVGEDGKPRDIKAISNPLGYGLDEKAIEAVRQWVFQPAMKDGKPVAVRINVEMTFHAQGGSPPLGPNTVQNVGVPFRTFPYTDAQQEELRRRWDTKPSSVEELDRLRSECTSYLDLNVEDLEQKKVALPPHECSTVLAWMRNLRVESLYTSNPSAK